MRAPIATRHCARSTTSGSRAAFSRTVSPSARQAAIIRFSVPVTVTVSMKIRAPLSRAAFAWMYPDSMPDLGAHGLQPLDVQVDGALADGASARQRDAGLPEPGHQGPEREDGGAHRLHQLVGRERIA